jgi:hypothetical protein
MNADHHVTSSSTLRLGLKERLELSGLKPGARQQSAALREATLAT